MQDILSGQGMEPSSSKLTPNLTSRVATSQLNYPSQAEHNFIDYVNLLLGSPSPRNQSLGQEAWKNYLEKKEHLESISITPLNTLILKSREVTTLL